MHNGVASVMGTPRFISPPGAIAAVLAAAAMVGACSLGGTPVGATRSPSASSAQSPAVSAAPSTSTPQATPSSTGPPPTPVVGAYGVLVTDQSAGSYTVSIIGIDGKVAASAQTSTPTLVTCPSAGAPVPLPVSTTNSRAYYMDAQGVVRYVAPNGQSGRAASVPSGTASRRSMFAVSPDDQRIAVIVNDYTQNGASTRLYVEDLNGGGNHLDIYSRSGSRTLWPIGWHGSNNLVVAVVPSCTQGGGPFCCGVQELHVVDPADATRRFTLGGIESCVIAGPASPAGAICWEGGTQSRVLNWTAGTVRTYPEQKPQLQYLSPNGSKVALVDDGGTSLQGTNSSMAGLRACAWMDDTHLLAGGDVQRQPRVLDVTSGATIPVAAEGICAGRLPGGL